jgi:hypothetical protein
MRGFLSKVGGWGAGAVLERSAIDHQFGTLGT